MKVAVKSLRVFIKKDEDVAARVCTSLMIEENDSKLMHFFISSAW